MKVFFHKKLCNWQAIELCLSEPFLMQTTLSIYSRVMAVLRPVICITY
jgi:hypothetical protein